MLKCEICGARIPNQRIMDQHMAKRHSDNVEEEKVITNPDISTVVEDEEEIVTIRTDVPVEVIINGKVFSGTELFANKDTAEEIKRLITVSYGKKVLV